MRTCEYLDYSIGTIQHTAYCCRGFLLIVCWCFPVFRRPLRHRSNVTKKSCVFARHGGFDAYRYFHKILEKFNTLARFRYQIPVPIWPISWGSFFNLYSPNCDELVYKMMIKLSNIFFHSTKFDVNQPILFYYIVHLLEVVAGLIYIKFSWMEKSIHH